MVFALFSFLTGEDFGLDNLSMISLRRWYNFFVLEAESFVASIRNLPTDDDYQMPLTYNGIFKRTFQDYFDGMSTYEMK